MNTIRQAAMAVAEAGGRVEYASALDNLRRKLDHVKAEITEAIRERDQNVQRYMDDMREKDAELATLRAKVAEMEGQEPVATVEQSRLALDGRWPLEDGAKVSAGDKLYLAPGAKP